MELEDQGSGGGGDARWRAVQSKVRLVHVDTKQTLTATQNVLPDWGFYIRCVEERYHADDRQTDDSQTDILTP